MAFSSLNAFNASKGMSGTQRTQSATFNPAASQPLQGQPQGMVGPPSPAPKVPTGSSYTLQGGMMGTGRQQAAAVDASNSQGVVPGRQQMADVGQPMPQMSAAEMQDPANAAMAGFQYAATQDQQPSASTNPGLRPPPPAVPPPAAGPPQGQSVLANRPIPARMM